MSVEEDKKPSYPCHLCGEPTDTFVRQSETRPGHPNHRFFEKKVPLCRPCFEEIQPTKANKQRVEFWRVIFPIIEEE